MLHDGRLPLKMLAFVMVLMLASTGARGQQPASELPVDPATAPAALVMISDPGCPYCARWEREVAPGYIASDDGKLAPLVRRYRNAPDIAFLPRIVYSPTFVMLVRGREIGRIVGYSGADLFWMQLASLIEDVRVALKRSDAGAPSVSARRFEWRGASSGLQSALNAYQIKLQERVPQRSQKDFAGSSTR